jgi:hypothetical protein
MAIMMSNLALNGSDLTSTSKPVFLGSYINGGQIGVNCFNFS